MINVVESMGTSAGAGMQRPPRRTSLAARWGAGLTALLALLGPGAAKPAAAQGTGPTVLDPSLTVRTVVSGLSQPTSMSFLGPNDILVLEKATGKVQRVFDGVLRSTVLDLAVNSASERGLLGMALHPDFPQKPWVYLYWTESSTGADTNDLAAVPLLGNRVDRFVWDGSTLTMDKNIVRLRAFQADAGQPLRGNHNGGIIRFALEKGKGRGGPLERSKLFIIIGDNGRRGLTQNVTSPALVPDDQFGGPLPDDAHLTGVILRLNDDGTIPVDNPFYFVGLFLRLFFDEEVGANVQKTFAYGVRNSFGMAVDPRSGALWTQENGDDSFDEINRVEPGMNGGWIQFMGPAARVAEYKALELALPPSGGVPGAELQQLRWPAALIADSPGEALSRLFLLPGAHYSDPEFSWKYAVAPAGIGFLDSRALGREYEGDLFVGAARPTLANGYLFRLKLTPNRKRIAAADFRLLDGVADNGAKFDVTESETLLFGRDFGVGTDIQTGPNGNLYVVSLSQGAIYEIYRR